MRTPCNRRCYFPPKYSPTKQVSQRTGLQVRQPCCRLCRLIATGFEVIGPPLSERPRSLICLSPLTAWFVAAKTNHARKDEIFFYPSRDPDRHLILSFGHGFFFY